MSFVVGRDAGDRIETTRHREQEPMRHHTSSALRQQFGHFRRDRHDSCWVTDIMQSNFLIQLASQRLHQRFARFSGTTGARPYAPAGYLVLAEQGCPRVSHQATSDLAIRQRVHAASLDPLLQDPPRNVLYCREVRGRSCRSADVGRPSGSAAFRGWGVVGRGQGRSSRVWVQAAPSILVVVKPLGVHSAMTQRTAK